MAHETTQIEKRSKTFIFELNLGSFTTKRLNFLQFFKGLRTSTRTRILMKRLRKFELYFSSYSKKLLIKISWFSPTTWDLKPTGILWIWTQKFTMWRRTKFGFFPFLIAPKISMCFSKFQGSPFKTLCISTIW